MTAPSGPTEEPFRARFGGHAAAPFGAESRDSSISPQQKLDAALAQFGWLLEAARPTLPPERAREAEEEIDGLRAFVQDFRRSDTISSSPVNEVRMEALIRSDETRPASLIRGNRLPTPMALGTIGELYDLDPDSFETNFAATGRIAMPRGLVGTGTLVRMTNDQGQVEGILTVRHVAEEIAASLTSLDPSDRAEIDFDGELGSRKRNRHRLKGVLASGPDSIRDNAALDAWDYALLGLGDSVDAVARPAPASAGVSERWLRDGNNVAVVGFLGRPDVAPSDLLPGTIWHRLLGGIYNVKRFAPARLMSRAAAGEAFQNLDQRVVLHDATTTGGASGGALLAAGGELVGLHLGGRSGAANIALRLDGIAAREQWDCQ